MAERLEYVSKMLRLYEESTGATGYGESVTTLAPVVLDDDFIANALSTALWTVAGVNSGTCASSTGVGGLATITTGDADDDDVDVASEIVFNSGKACGCEARVRINDVSGTAFNFGFSDAKGEAADAIAATYSGTTLTSNATDCALFFHDPDATTDAFRTVAVSNDTDGTVDTITSTSPGDADWHIYRVQSDTSGNVDFYFDGVSQGTANSGLRSAVNLCVYLGAINREATGNTVDVDYIRAWQER